MGDPAKEMRGMMRNGSILILGATIVAPSSTFIGDCRIENGVICEVVSTEARNGLVAKEGESVVNAEGLYLIPGCIDPQVHFREPGHPEKEDLGSGSKAAASGGITGFLDMPNNKPSVTTLAGMQKKLDSAANSCVTNYGFFIGATKHNLADLQEAVGTPEAPHSIPGICGIKIFMGSSTGNLLVDTDEALENIFANTAGLIAVHAEDEDRLNERWPLFEFRTDIEAHAEWRDDRCALLATQRSVNMAVIHCRRLHVLHLTSGIESTWLKGKTSLPAMDIANNADASSNSSNNPASASLDATANSPLITTETLPQHLTFAEEEVHTEDVRLKMNPPIRTSTDRQLLWEGLRNGTIQCIATDHAPHTLEDKSLGFPKAPSGMPGVETSLAVMLNHANSGKCTLEEVVKWMSPNVAACYGMEGKGVIAEGMDGDVVLIDMELEIEVKDENSWSRVGWNPFRGRKLSGWPVLTVVGGVPVFERTEATGPKGRILVADGVVGEPIIMAPWK